jgi:hypothetical protein
VNNLPPPNQQERPRSTVIKVFVALLLVALLLRIFYAGHLYQDDGLWFTAAEEILRGKALYREIYFDKPPGLPLLYALLFKLFGVHILTIRLFTILYSVATGFALYLFGARLYEKRLGLLAAAMFVVFSNTSSTGHVQGLNTDFLMALPYTLGAYWFVLSTSPGRLRRGRRTWYTLAGGAAVGVAFQVNPKALFDLAFFLVIFLLSKLREKREQAAQTANTELEYTPPLATSLPLPVVAAFLLTASGFLAGALPFFIYLAATHSLTDYWICVWDWGRRYATYYTLGHSLFMALRQSIGYFALNNTLLIGVLFVVVTFYKRISERMKPGEVLKQAVAADSKAQAWFRSDATLLLWLALSFTGMSVGGRFFGHYFFQILPSLCLLGARGISNIVTSLSAQGKERRLLRRAIFALLIIGFFITLIRFHTRTVTLASDWFYDTKSEATRKWFHEKLNAEDRLVAAVVKDWPDGADDVERLGLEELRDYNSLKNRQPEGRKDYLFVWGYRPEIYYWSGVLPASRFLSTQLLTGVPADVHFFGETYVQVLDDKTTAFYRAQLLRDLQARPPKYIIDELGFFNNDLNIQNYPELKEFLKDYKFSGATGRFFIYHYRAPKDKNKSSESANP